MSTELVQSVPGSLTAALGNVDEESKNFDLKSNGEDAFIVGPFCVLKFESDPGSSARAAESETGATVSNDADEFDGSHSPEPQRPSAPFRQVSGRAPMSAESPLGNLDSLHWEDLFTWDVSALGDFSFPPSDMLQNEDASALPSSLGWNETQALYSQAAPVLTGDIDASELMWLDMDLTIDAPFLLRHFDQKVIDQMGSLPINEKSAWRTLHYPSAVMTLSDLTILDTDREKVKYANLATFYALVAVSALHQSLNHCDAFANVVHPDEHWKTLASRAYNSAKHAIRRSLERECKPPRKAKYKEHLMGISATLAFAVGTIPGI